MTSVFSTFWSGKITLREYVCINSFLANSHKYYIYSYEKLNGLPEGAELKNAEEIIPKEEYLLYKQKLPNRWDLFSDKFRYSHHISACIQHVHVFQHVFQHVFLW